MSSLLNRVLAARKTDLVDYEPLGMQYAWTPPNVIPGALSCAAEIAHAAVDGKRACVFGDYDVDGLTASIIMAAALRTQGAEPGVIIPNRLTEGYGMTQAAVNRMLDTYAPEVVVTVDTGCTAREMVDYLRERGIDVVITDHHTTDLATVPRGVPFCDPETTHHHLCGCEVAAKVAQALGLDVSRYVDLMAVATIADVMPMDNPENRAIIAEGLRFIRETPRPWLVALAEVAQFELCDLTAEDIAFAIAPRLNACGRMGDAMLAYELLTCDNVDDAVEIAYKVETYNDKRKEETERVLSAYGSEYEDAATGGRLYVVRERGLHAGVLGIAAAKLAEEHHMPCLVMTDKADGAWTGSIRSYGGADVMRALRDVASAYAAHPDKPAPTFGGHQGAAGCKLANETEARRFTLLLCRHMPKAANTEGEAIPCELGDVTVDAIKELDKLAPYGEGNPKPLWRIRCYMDGRKWIGASKNHLSFKACDGATSVAAVWFAPVPRRAWDETGYCELVAEVNVNRYMGRETAQLLVRDATWEG